MAQRCRARTSRAERSPLAHLRPPVPAGHRKLDLAEDDVDERGKDLVLVSDVVVDRHRLGPELLREGADGERPQSAAVGDGERGLDHPLPGQPRSPPAVLADCLGHAPSLIPFRPPSGRLRTLYDSIFRTKYVSLLT